MDPGAMQNEAVAFNKKEHVERQCQWALSFLCKIFATLEIVQGKSPHRTIANKKSCSFLVQRS